MRIVVFGLTVSSSWGNGHATLWRGLIRALAARGHHVTFFERDVPYYAGTHRDLQALPDGQALHLYADWDGVLPLAERELQGADAAIVTSYCPDGVAATDLVLGSDAAVKAFYDLDTPVTLERLRAGEPVAYLGPRLLRDFDIVLSYTGGEALLDLQRLLGARAAVPLYGWVDPELHRPTEPQDHYAAALSYLGTYAADRQEALERLLVEPARRRPERRFVIGGAQYPDAFPWAPNIYFVRHLPPVEHPAFFASSPATLNVTRAAMARSGWCPSGRLFEAAACGTALVSDDWPGLSDFFEPGREVLVVATAEDVMGVLDLSPDHLRRVAAAGRERALAEHTAHHRADQLVALLQGATPHVPVRDAAAAAAVVQGG